MKNIIKISVIILFLASIEISCIKTYLSCNHDFKVYVPQIFSGDAKNMLLAVYDTSGTLIYNKLYPSFEELEYTDSLLHIPLSHGKYNVIGFANIDSLSIEQNIKAELSTLSLKQDLNGISNNTYSLGNSFLLAGGSQANYEKGLSVPFIDTLNLDVITGTIKTILRGFPSDISNISLSYLGLATKVNHNRILGAPDQSYVTILKNGNIPTSSPQADIIISKNVLPSIGQISLELIFSTQATTFSPKSEFTIKKDLDLQYSLQAKNTLEVLVEYDPKGDPSVKVILIPWENSPDGSEDVDM